MAKLEWVENAPFKLTLEKVLKRLHGENYAEVLKNQTGAWYPKEFSRKSLFEEFFGFDLDGLNQRKKTYEMLRFFFPK